MVFSLHLVYLSPVACISEGINLGPCWRKDILRVKGQAQITKCSSLWVGAINLQKLSVHYLMRQQIPMVFLFLLVYLSDVACIPEEISLIVLLYFNTSTNYLHHYYISVHNISNIFRGWAFYPGLVIFPGVITPTWKNSTMQIEEWFSKLTYSTFWPNWVKCTKLMLIVSINM